MTDEDRQSRTYPARPIVAVGAVVFKGEDVLMIKRAKPPISWVWTLPGGGVELGERLEDAVHREVMEETAIGMRLLGLVDAVDAIVPDEDGRIRHHYALIDYAAEWVSGEPEAGDDAADAQWIAWADIPSLSLWDETVRVMNMAREIYDRSRAERK